MMHHKFMKNNINKELVTRLKDFIELEMRSNSMDMGCITPVYAQRMLKCRESLEEIGSALKLAKEQWTENYQ